MGTVITFLCISAFHTTEPACQKSVKAFLIVSDVTATEQLFERYYINQVQKRVDRNILLIATPAYALLVDKRLSITFTPSWANSINLQSDGNSGNITISWGFP